MHKYFVSYSFTTSLGYGNGSIGVELEKPVRSMEDVEDIRKFIEDTYCGNQLPIGAKVVVMYWRRFEEE